MSAEQDIRQRIAAIDDELGRDARLKAERDALAAQLETTTEPAFRYVFRGVGQALGKPPKTVVETDNGAFVVMPHLHFERAVSGEAPSPLSREEFEAARKAGRVYQGGYKNEVSPDTAARLEKAGFQVAKEQVRPQRTSRILRSAQV